ncbi:hypothetical protein LBMAG52_00760 [Planctomycetia bacterium]|nr:hypothetical protein LBMAG52_00760 [Planctomycetia bacterium]
MLLAEMKRLSSQTLRDKFSTGGGWETLTLLAGALCLLIMFHHKIRDWLRPKGLMENSPERLLMQFRDIHKQGDLSADEYKNIREQLTKRSGESGRAGNASSGPSADDSAGSSSTIPQ